MYEYSLARSVSLPRSAINLRCSVWVLRIDRVCIQVGTGLASPILSNSVSWPFIQSWTSKHTRCRTMGSPQNTRRGLRGSQSARSEPQHAWDSFLLASSVSEISKGGPYLCSKMMSVPQAEVEVEKISSEGHMLEAMPSQKQTPRRRGRPRKNKEVGGSHILTELSAHPTAEEFIMHATWLEPVGTTSRGSGSRMRRTGVSGSNVENPNQQLEQAQLSIAELYQENRELWRQLVVQNQEVSTPPGHEGSTNWLKRQLREAQDTIVQLREAQRMMEEENIRTLQGAQSSLGEGPCAGDT
jgi:hypothetical protein